MSQDIYKLPGKQPATYPGAYFLGLMGIFVLALIVGTEYVASKVNVAEPAWMGVHNPLGVILWAIKYRGMGADQIFAQGLNLTLWTVVAGAIILWLYTFFARRAFKATDVHGSAKWAGIDDLKKGNLLDQPDGLYIGKWEDETIKGMRYLRDNSDSHAIIIAPTRSGKGVGAVIPNLLTWRGSVIVNDIKGENYKITSAYRKKALDQYVACYDPAGIMEGVISIDINPLYEIRMGENEVRDAQGIAEDVMSADDAGSSHHYDTHWTLAAKSLLVGLILHVLYAREDKSLAGVLFLLTDSNRTLKDLFWSMEHTEHDPDLKQGWKDPATMQPIKTHPVVAMAARAMLNKHGTDEFAGVISTLTEKLAVFRDPKIANRTRSSDLKISDFMYGEKPVSLYLVVPPSDIKRLRLLIKIIVSLLCNRMLEKIPAGKFHKTLLMLDEFPALGKMDILVNSLSYMAGYGIRAFFITQDLDQLFHIYGKDSPILSHFKIRIVNTTNSDITARRVSGFVGDSTVVKYSKNYSEVDASHVSEGVSESKRALITPDEIMRLPQTDTLIFLEGMRPIYGRKIKYYENAEFAKMAEHGQLADSDKKKQTSEYDSLRGKVFEAVKKDIEEKVPSADQVTPQFLKDKLSKNAADKGNEDIPPGVVNPENMN